MWILFILTSIILLHRRWALLLISFLLLPLSEVVDEHYTVYFCLGDRLAAGRQMPRFCT